MIVNYNQTQCSFEISSNSDSSAGAFNDTSWESMYEDYEDRYPELADVYDDLGVDDENIQATIKRRYYYELHKLIKWVYEVDDDTFKADFEKHFNLSNMINYFLFALVDLRADNLGI